MKSVNDKGEYAIYDRGDIIGYKKVELIQGVKVIDGMKIKILAMMAAASKDKINLTLAAGLRTFDEQFDLRKRHVIDKSKVDDEEYLLNAPSSAFNPVTAKPGWSNHQDGKAYDFNVTGKPEVYQWLVKNALKFGFIRTVASERWHWEYMPYVKDMFIAVLKNHPTWDNLV